MVKHGPCCHCGATSTPLWRNGPPDKPVLCNACGSRWRTKGTLLNYVPNRTREVHELHVPKRQKEKNNSFKASVKNLQEGQWSNRIPNVEYGIGECGQSFPRGVDEDVSNRSSSGSALSFSESCAHFSCADMSEVTGSLQSKTWETTVPSKRAGIIHPKRSTVQKLTMDLHSIMHAQPSYLTMSSEEGLLYKSSTPTGLIEIGNGSMLIKHPNSAINDEEESEACSVQPRNKSDYSAFQLNRDFQNKGSTISGMCNTKIKTTPIQELSKRNKSSQETFRILQSKNSKLGFIDLDDIVCYERYMKMLTNEERLYLLEYLPSVDTAKTPESLESMFTSHEFTESLTFFQRLLREGIFDSSATEMKSEDCEHLRDLILCNLSKSAWADSYKIHQSTTYPNTTGTGRGASLKRPLESRNDNFAETKVTMKCPKRTCTAIHHPSLVPLKSFKRSVLDSEMKPNTESSKCLGSNGSTDSPASPYFTPSQKSSIFSSMQPIDSSPDEDLLLDVQSNVSFPDAELISDVSTCRPPTRRFPLDSGVSGKDGITLRQSAMRLSSDLKQC